MQFQGLSQSFGGASLPRDSHLVQAIAAQEGDEALENDELEERALRRLSRQRRQEAKKARVERERARERQPATLESFLEEPDEERHRRDEEDAALLSGDSDEDSDNDDEDTGHPNGQGTSALDASTPYSAGASLKKHTSNRSSWARRISIAAPVNHSGFSGIVAGPASEFTPLLGVPTTPNNRKASISTLTPRPLQRLYKSGAPVNPARKVGFPSLRVEASV